MTLTPAQIRRIEAILTAREDGVSIAGIMINYDLPGPQEMSGFFSVLRALGVEPVKPKWSRLSRADLHAIAESARRHRHIREMSRGVGR